MKQALLLFLLLATAFAGCAETDPLADPAQSDPQTRAPKALNATAVDAAAVQAAGPDANVTAPSWFGLDLDAAVTGFRWTVPADSIRSYRFTESFSYEAVPILVTLLADDVDGYGVFVYDLSQGARLVASTVDAAMTYQSYYLLPTPSEGGWEPAPRPLALVLPERLAGKEVGIVVATDGLTGDAGFAWTVMDEMPFGRDTVPETTKAFLDDREGPVGVVTPTGRGDAYRFSLHTEYYGGFLYTPGVFGAVYGTGDVTVEERLPTWIPPYGGARDATILAQHDLSGWSFGYQYTWNGAGAGTYAGRTDVQGTSGASDGVMLDVPFVVGGADSLLTGLPYLYAQADGSGGATSSLDLRMATDNDFFLTILELVSFDATLEELLGVGSVNEMFTHDGLVRMDESGVARFDADGGAHLRPLR